MKTLTFIPAFIMIFLLSALTGCNNRPEVAEENRSWIIGDSTVEMAIKKEFKAHPFITSSDIVVRAHEGIITLSGKTDNIIEKKKAAGIVRLVRGVKGVVNLIEVDVPPVEDDILAEQIDETLYRDPVLESYEITEKVDSGVVKLYGRVNSWQQKQLAEKVVESVEGVREVKNNIAFVYQEERPDLDIKADIAELMKNDVRIEDGLIDISVKDDTVLLKGTVGSASEKNLAIAQAWVAGVDTVVASGLEVSGDERDPLMREDKFVEKPDPMIIEDIQRSFLHDPRLLNHDIRVLAENGKVTLSGKTGNYRAKKAAGQDASNVVGVFRVINNIRVEPVAMPAEKTVKDQIKTAFERHPLFDNYQITAVDDSGKVTLTGKVDFYFEKIQAEELVSSMPGVVDISNKIEVTNDIEFPYLITPGQQDLPVLKQPVTKNDKQIKDEVEYQLWWSPFVDRNQVDVEVNDGEVTLTGTVNTQLEMDYAVKNAYQGGAFRVINKLDVDFWQI
ncbi:MAG: BON domain-containing protein [Bacteroidales bacterium]|nr:BON domain-containing protein [Bacteroidales bacterium]